MKKSSVYAIITARGNSKSLPRKNVRLLSGLPLIAYSIKAALGCKLISRCFVSTEDPEIKSISLRYGAEVIDRPKKLSTGLSLSSDVLVHALKTLKRMKALPDYFALLQPTSPLRKSGHLEECLRKFFLSHASSAVSVVEAEHHPYKEFYLEKHYLEALFHRKYLDQPRQLLPKVFRQNGAIYISDSSLFLKKGNLFIPPVMPYFMKPEESIDIDTAIDFKLAELLINERK